MWHKNVLNSTFIVGANQSTKIRDLGALQLMSFVEYH